MSNAGKFAGAALSIVGAGASVYATKDYIFQDLSADVSGTWAIDLTIQDSALSTLKGVTVRYFVTVQQDRLKLTGEGEKVCENGQSIDAQARTRLELIGGKVEGSSVTMAFRDHGKRRMTTGSLRLTANSADTMDGSFTWTAADSTGVTAAKKTTGVRCD
jgi:hypothetical protein